MGVSFFRSWGLVLCWCLAWAAGARAAEVELSKLAVPSQGDGVVIVSLSVSSVETMVMVSFALMEGEGPVKVDQHSVGRVLFSFNEQLSGVDGRWGRVVALKLRPGSYRWGVVSAYPGGARQGQVRNSEDIHRTFVVEPNKVLYLGNLDVMTLAEPGFKAGNVLAALLFGVMNFDVQARPHVRNMWEADLKVIRSQHPSFDPAVVDMRLMRDKRDDAIEQTIADVQAAAAAGHAWARDAWAEASVLGYAVLPDQRLLRLPATLAFDQGTFDSFVASAGNPEALGALVQWVLDEPVARTRAPLQLAPATMQALVQAAADRYSVLGALHLSRDARLGVANDTTLRGVWKNRLQAVRLRDDLSQSDVLEILLGKLPAQQLADIKDDRRLVAMTPSGRHVTWTSDGTEPLETAAQQLIKRCQEETGEACWMAATDRRTKPPICNAAMRSTGLAQSHPPAHWPEVTAQAVAGAPWAATYLQWQAQGKAAEAHPRSLVWDAGLQRGFAAAGDCLASHRALQACKAQGGQSCQVVLQDDKLVTLEPSLTPPGKS